MNQGLYCPEYKTEQRSNQRVWRVFPQTHEPQRIWQDIGEYLQPQRHGTGDKWEKLSQACNET